MNKLRIIIALALVAVSAVAQTSKTPIYNGILQSDLDFASYKALNANLSDYAGANMTWNVSTNKFDVTGGTGTVTSFSAGNLSPLFTTTVGTATTTPALSFTLSTAAANSWFGNATGSTAAPAFNITAFPLALIPTITYAKIQNVSANSKLLGSSATGAGAPPSEITLGTNLSMSGSTLNATGGGGGTVTSITATAPIVVTPTPLTATGVISITGAALTQTNDTNVTLTLGGTPSTALLAPASITAGWTGTLAIGRGGTGASTAPTALTALGGEPALGNPSTNGYVLSSTTAGTRSWVAQSGGGGTPAGANTDIQYNDSSAFGGDANLTWDKTNKVETITIGTPAANTANNALVLQDTTASTAGSQQFSGAIQLTGTGWKTAATAASQSNDIRLSNKPVQGTANPHPQFNIDAQTNALGFQSLIKDEYDVDNGNWSNILTLSATASHGAWIDLPTSGPSAIGSGGAGGSAWIAYSAVIGQWFAEANPADICYRSTTGNRALIGNAASTGGYATFSVGPSMAEFSNQAGLTWSSTQLTNAAVDIGLYRNSAGVLEIDNGTVGQFRDLKARNVNVTTAYQINGTPTAGDYINSSTSDLTVSTTDIYVAGSNVVVPAGAFAAKGQYHCAFDMAKTAGTGAIVISVRIGTAGTTADTAQITFTFGAGTAVSDTGSFDVYVVFRSVGSGTSAVISGFCAGKHNAATNGLFAGPQVNTIVGTTSAGFDSSAATTIGVSFNGGTAFAGTNKVVQATYQQ